MNTKEFKKESIRSGPRLRFSDKAYGGLPWEDWYKLANMTRKINYWCNFRGDGTCTQMRATKSNNEMCCCNSCAHYVGYLSFIQNDPEVIAKIASCFKAKVGFWRKGKGCILPRKYRSATCLGYRCHEISGSSIEGRANILIAFLNSIRLRSTEGNHIYILGKALLKTGI